MQGSIPRLLQTEQKIFCLDLASESINFDLRARRRSIKTTFGRLVPFLGR